MKFLFVCSILLFAFLGFPKSAQAIVDPLASPNNKFGIFTIGTSIDETSPAATLVNSSGGDWGYITVLVESKNRDQNLWQKFFDDLRRRHLIPIVRLATGPEGNSWKLPYEGEEQAWADFLDSLVWPIKNRYVVIYNEPNHGLEWAGKVDPKSYAEVLDKTIDALKKKNPDFFVLNAGLDASTPSEKPNFEEEAQFLKDMNNAVPGIFDKLDGWASHSYPNPAFAGSPGASGKGTVRTFEWELNFLKSLGVQKTLPVFITETGWRHAEGITLDRSLPSVDRVAGYFEEAFENAWNNNQIVAVTPFLLNYQEELFDHFSFKKITSEKQDPRILGSSYPEYYSPYQVLTGMAKTSGRPVQENQAQLIHGSIYSSVVAGESYQLPLTFKNTGQSIWNEYEPVELRATDGAVELNVPPVKVSGLVGPGDEVVFNVAIKATEPGVHKLTLQLFAGNQPFAGNIYQYQVEAKSPVILSVASKLAWKNDFSGEYLLKIISEVIKDTTKIVLNSGGKSDLIEDKYILPDYTFSFTLYKPFYKPRTLDLKVKSGVNNLDFGTLEPDFFSALFNPVAFWKLLPFSN